MSVKIKVLNEQDWNGREYAEHAFREGGWMSQFDGVIGYVIAAVVKAPDTGAITLEREARTFADSGDDNTLAVSVVKTIERKLNEAFPDPNKQEPDVKLWVPDGY